MKNLELIPIIEIWGNSKDITFPKEGPYWKYPSQYSKARSECLAASGYEPMQAYLEGSNFYKLEAVSDVNLLLQIKNRIEGYKIEDICPFDGGYILKIQGKDMLFPQCCGDLSDIQYWRELSKGKSKLYWEGHPQPFVKINGNEIQLSLDDEGLEDFEPTPLERVLIIDVVDLQEAVKHVTEKVQVFADRIDKLVAKNNLDINKASNLLVWGINL